MNTYDVTVIGGGVIGTSIARYLSRYEGRFLLLEACNDVSCGASKANSGIVHAGFDAATGTDKAYYNVLGNKMYKRLCKELDVPFLINGALVTAFEETGINTLRELAKRGKRNGVRTQLLDGQQARQKEPALSGEVIAALYAPDSGIVSPYELTIALCENAAANGVELRTQSRVTDIYRDSNGIYNITAGGKLYLSRAVVNCAGLYGDVLHNMLNTDKIRLYPRRGEYCLFDKTANNLTHTVFPTPGAMGKGILVTPTVHGNLMAGPTAHDIGDKEDKATTEQGLGEVLEYAKRTVNGIDARAIITQFSGLRSKIEGGDDFFIKMRGTYAAAIGIDSPGLASAPAIGDKISTMIAEELKLKSNLSFEPCRSAIPSFSYASTAKKRKLIASDPDYGRIICRCENVTEAEIKQAVARGAVDLDGVKRRVRAQMGRCQGGFCSIAVMDILSKQLNLPHTALTKCGGGSYIVKEEDARE